MKATLVLIPVTIQVAASGDLAVEEGNWTWSAPSPQGDQKDAGKYLVSWRKMAEGWRVTQDIWNSDQPPPVPAPATGKKN
jgi:ketosteroid isomerase-like protein